MPRNDEVMRQWRILRLIEAARLGLTVNQLAEDTGKTTRTIYRDIVALQEVGFPLVSESRDGRTYWMLDGAPFKHLTQIGFSLSEWCALSLSRRLVETLTGVPFQDALNGAFAKFEEKLPVRMQDYLNRLPSIMVARPSAGKIRKSPRHEEFVEKLVEASLERRHVSMSYYSASHDRTRDYLVYPLRVVYMHGGLYLRAWVPEYSQLRTFATQRIRKLAVLEERFVPAPEWTEEPFSSSLGPNDGPAEHVCLRFDPSIAQVVRERVYHPSQRMEMNPDGSLTVEMDVCVDAWLSSLILQFGHLVRVVEPQRLALAILDELKTAIGHYAPPADLDAVSISPAMLDFSAQSRLPF